MEKFKVGDNVFFLGATVVMIIKKINSDGSCVCVWQDKEGKPHEEEYPSEILRKYDETSGGII